jgi:hypothetical protein
MLSAEGIDLSLRAGGNRRILLIERLLELRKSVKICKYPLVVLFHQRPILPIRTPVLFLQASTKVRHLIAATTIASTTIARPAITT